MTARCYPLPASLTLSLMGACAPGVAQIQLGEADADADADTDADPDADTDADVDATLTGGWSLDYLDGYELNYTYTYENCTYAVEIGLRLEFGAESSSGIFSGHMGMNYTYAASGEGCEYDGESGSYYETYYAEGERMGARAFEIGVSGIGLYLDCELGEDTDDALECRFNIGGDTGTAGWSRD